MVKYDFSTMPGFFEFSYGADYGLEFACAHLCEHCKAGDKPERVSDEQIDLIKAEIIAQIAYGWTNTPSAEDHMWRHTPRKDERSGVEIKPLCKASSLHEAWRNEK